MGMKQGKRSGCAETLGLPAGSWLGLAARLLYMHRHLLTRLPLLRADAVTIGLPVRNPGWGVSSSPVA